MHNESASIDTGMNTSTVDIQYATQSDYVPDAADITLWVNAATQAVEPDSQLAAGELTIRIVTEKEITELNQQYRHKSTPTNVLSVPYEPMVGVNISLLGDIVVCADVVNQEAIEQNKSPADHWAHIVIHGMLHLLGFDHIADSDAEKMETSEIKILKNLGINNPYQVNDNE